MQQSRVPAKYKTHVVIIVALIGLGMVGWFWFAPGNADPETVEISQPDEQFFAPDADVDEPATPEPTEDTGVVVHVTGAVQQPDVYRLPAEARVKDLVLAAGGLTVDAAADAINLAQRLKDGEQIHVPRRGETPQPNAQQPETASTPALIDINTAGVAELDTLEGIGATLAQRIVEYRTANGPFAAVEDLQNVKGISGSLVAKIAPLITAGP